MKFNIKDRILSEKTALLASVLGLFIMLFFLGLFLMKGNWAFQGAASINEEKIGQFGDFIGGTVGSIFSLVGVILFYVALSEQRKDISINQESARIQTAALQKQIEEFEKQKEELELTRQVYENQLKSMAEQEKTMKIQQFDSTFYSLLNVYISIKSELNRVSENNNFFESKFELLKAFVPTPDLEDPLRSHIDIVSGYMKLFFAFKGQFTHYFKTLYRLIKIVDSNSLLDESQKKFYCKIIRAQFDEYESQILYYNFHCVYGEKAKILMYKYNMLKHLHPLSKIHFQNNLVERCFDPTLISFCDRILAFLERSVNRFCTNYDIEYLEEKIIEYNCSVILEYKEGLKLKLIMFDKSIVPDNFFLFVKNLIYDILFISQFRIINDGILVDMSEEDDLTLIFTYFLNQKKIGKLNIDN